MVSGPTAFSTRTLDLKPVTSAWNLAVAKRDAQALVRHHLGSAWNIKFRKTSGHAGKCVFDTKTLLFSTSWTLELGREEFRQTVLHEIGHAIAGWSAGHGPIWESAVRSIGGIPNEKVDTAQHEFDKEKVFKWTITCPCGKIEMHRARKTEKLERSICLSCRGKVICTQNF